MPHNSLNPSRILHTAAWTWLAYLFMLAIVDGYLYGEAPSFVPLHYYLVNVSLALLFLGLSYWSWLRRKLAGFYTPVMVFLISGATIIANRLWIPPLPQAPLSNIEGLALRLLPVLFIGLVITAWHYSGLVVALFALGTFVLEIAILELRPPPQLPGLQAVIFVAIVRSVSFLVVGYFIHHLMRQLRVQQAQLAEANAQLVHYSSTIEHLTTSRERNRLARELHDTLAHTLSGLSVQLETAEAYWDVDPKTTRRLLAESLAATRSGLDETRRALKALRASPIDDLGLLLAMQQLAESAAERAGLVLSIALPDRNLSLSHDVEQCLYRIAQEALENVVRHANAQHLEFQLRATDGEVLLRIQDDGLGFDIENEQPPDRYGLQGMYERAQMARGKLTIDSRPNLGTEIRLSFRGVGHDQSVDL